MKQTKTKTTKKPRRTVYGNAIKAIFLKFVKPLAERVTSDTELPFDYGLKHVFSCQTRQVWFAKAVRSFRMPGKTWKGEDHRKLITGVGNRQIKKGEPFVVRFDTMMHNRCEVESTNQNIIFVMTHAQWTVIKEHLEFIA